MITTLFSTIALFLALSGPVQPLVPSDKILAVHEMPLDDRYAVKSVNDVFKDNILLNMAYLEGKVSDPKNIDWQTVEKPFHYEFTLKPNQTFAFHNDVLPGYQASLVKTTNAHFNYSEGFKSDGYLYGDGVCHLASLINWAAKDANLNVLAPTNHNFANIPDIPKQYGVAIYDMPGQSSSAEENLYVTNNQPNDVTFVFNYSNNKLQVSVSEKSDATWQI